MIILVTMSIWKGNESLISYQLRHEESHGMDIIIEFSFVLTMGYRNGLKMLTGAFLFFELGKRDTFRIIQEKFNDCKS